jgi:hypothetical protein
VSLRTCKPQIDLNVLAGAIFPGGGGHPGKAGAGAILEANRVITDFVDLE